MYLKKKLCLLSLLGLMVILAVGCHKNKVSTKRISIQMFEMSYAKWIELANNRIKLFKKEYPNINVRLITATRKLEKLQTMIAGKSAPDIAFLQVEEVPLFARRGTILDLTPFIEEDTTFDINDYYSPVVKGMQYKGRQFGIPENFSPVVLFYNKDLFDEAGVSYPDENWTWEEFLDASKRLTKDKNNDGRIDQYGFLRMMGNHRYPIYIWQNNGRIYNEDRTKCVIDSPEAIEALKWYYALTFKHNVTPKRAEQMEGVSNQTAEALFGSGKIAMLASTRYFIGFIKESKFDCEIAPLPKGKRRATAFVGGGWVILKQSKHPREAWNLIKTLVGDEGSRMVGEAGRALPALKKAAEETVNHPGVQPENDKIFIDSVEYSFGAPYLFEDLAAESRAGSYFELVEIGKMSVEECCREYAKTINDAIMKMKTEKGEK